MKIKAIPAEQLSPAQLNAWDRLQRADGAVDNPMFRPEFTQAVARVRDDVEVAVLEADDAEDSGAAVGFLPFQRSKGNVALPVASVMSDMHGMVADRQVDYCPQELLRQCHLSAWQFDHLVASQTPFQPYHQCVEDSPYIDLSEGFETYLQQRRKAGCSSISQAQRKARKLAREVGPIRFEIHTESEEVLEKLIQWKRQQLARHKYSDVFQHEWVVALLKEVQQLQTEGFSGMLSTLYAGESLVAVHLGMRSYGVIGSWIPTYDPQQSKYSPGLLIHLELARAAAEMGVRRIDLGRGYNQLKSSLMSDAIPVALGAVDRRPINRLITTAWYGARELANSTAWGSLSRMAYRRLRRVMAR